MNAVYLQKEENEFVCTINCPVILEWSSWSCHCTYGVGDLPAFANNANLPSCPCPIAGKATRTVFFEHNFHFFRKLPKLKLFKIRIFSKCILNKKDDFKKVLTNSKLL